MNKTELFTKSASPLNAEPRNRHRNRTSGRPPREVEADVARLRIYEVAVYRFDGAEAVAQSQEAHSSMMRSPFWNGFCLSGKANLHPLAFYTINITSPAEFPRPTQQKRSEILREMLPAPRSCSCRPCRNRVMSNEKWALSNPLGGP
jgi:hypothetical protein